MIVELAWKNIWRNKLRSGVILGAITVGLFSGTFLSSVISGWTMSSVIDDINNQLSYIQIHDTAFVANNDIAAVFDRQTIAGQIARSPEVSAVSYRLSLTGMLASATNAAGITVKGVDVDEEKAVTTLWQQIPDSLGAFLPDEAKMPVVVSRKLAEKLKIRLKSKLVLTFQDAGGEMQSIAFRVCGIYKTSNSAFDEGNIFVRQSDLASYTALPDGAVHEAALKVAGLDACKTAAVQLKEALPLLDVQSWDELNPVLALSLSWTDLMAIIILGIFLLALSFGIVNTMLMAVLERTRELSMLGAIGMSKGRIFRMIMLETMFLTFVGSMAGLILGVATVLPTVRNGINLSFMTGDTFEDYGFSSIVYPILNAKMFVQILVLVMLAGILSAIYPAQKARTMILR